TSATCASTPPSATYARPDSPWPRSPGVSASATRSTSRGSSGARPGCHHGTSAASSAANTRPGPSNEHPFHPRLSTANVTADPNRRGCQTSMDNTAPVVDTDVYNAFKIKTDLLDFLPTEWH